MPARGGYFEKIEIPEEVLIQLYVNERKTVEEVCVAIGVKSPITVRKQMKKYGINTRDVNKERSLIYNINMSEEEFEKDLKNKYLNEKLSMIQLSKHFGVSHTIIKKYLIKYGVEIRTKKQAMELYSGPNNHKWNEGIRYHSQGYKQLHKPDHPNCDGCGFVYEHRYVMEQHLGRYLEKNEHVHHINCNKTDNRLKNLEVLTSSEHAKVTMRERMKRKNKNQIQFDFKDIN